MFKYTTASLPHRAIFMLRTSVSFSLVLLYLLLLSFVVQAAGGSGGVVSHNAHLHITYSAGVQALQLGKYSTALRCFQVSPGHPPPPPPSPALWAPLRTCTLHRTLPPFSPCIGSGFMGWMLCNGLAWFMLDGISC